MFHRAFAQRDPIRVLLAIGQMGSGIARLISEKIGRHPKHDHSRRRQKHSLALQQRGGEEIVGNGGYYNAVEVGQFVDSGYYPERNGDGIALYGLRPSATFAHPAARDLKPVMELKTQIVFVKEVAAGVGLSYGHAFRSQSLARIATLPIGYGDGLSRSLSGRIDVLIHGRRCPQVGRITMEMSLVDVTAPGDQVALGDEAVIIGRQGAEEISADELASKLGTINYEIVTAIAHRVPRLAVAKQTE